MQADTDQYNIQYATYATAYSRAEVANIEVTGLATAIGLAVLHAEKLKLSEVIIVGPRPYAVHYSECQGEHAVSVAPMFQS